MIKLTQSFAHWLYENYPDIYTLVLFGHIELVTPAMAKAYIAWCKTEEGKQYLKGGSKYAEGV